MKKYSARNGAPLSDEQAQRYGEFIEELCDNDGGVLPQTLVERMDDPRIRDWFNETDDEAAYKWRVDKARHLLQYIEVELRDPDGNLYKERAFFPVTIEVVRKDDEGEYRSTGAKRVYRPTIEILRVPQQREEVFEDVLNRFRAMRQKYRHFKELKEVFEAIDRL